MSFVEVVAACFKKAVFRAQFGKHLSCLATKFTDSVVSPTIFHHLTPSANDPKTAATSFTLSPFKAQCNLPAKVSQAFTVIEKRYLCLLWAL